MKLAEQIRNALAGKELTEEEKNILNNWCKEIFLETNETSLDIFFSDYGYNYFTQSNDYPNHVDVPLRLKDATINHLINEGFNVTTDGDNAYVRL